MPLIQLHHEQRNRLGNTSHDSIEAALETSYGSVGRLTIVRCAYASTAINAA